MKFLITGDWHLTKKSPENRLDDYWDTVQNKVQSIFRTADRRSIDIILQPGDLFDTARVPFDVAGFLGNELSFFDGDFLSVPGQHDLRFHNLQNPNTPFHMMNWSDLICQPDPDIDYGSCCVYGAGWGGEIPKIKDQDQFNVLLIHRMIIRDRRGKVWAGQEEYSLAAKLLQETGFNLIVSGDNHQSFTSSHKDQLLFNCGSLLRSTIAQAEHKPVVYILDTDNPSDFETIELDILPFDEVMDLEKKERGAKRDERLDKFIQQLQSTKMAKLNYKENVYALMKEVDKSKKPLSQGTKSIIEQIMD